MPWRTDEDGSRTYVIWAELLVAEGHEVDAVADALLGELSARHDVVGWERSAGQGLAGTELEVELVDDEQDMAVRRSLLELAETSRASTGSSWPIATRSTRRARDRRLRATARRRAQRPIASSPLPLSRACATRAKRHSARPGRKERESRGGV
jgi:hypothetical protein